MEKVVLIFAMLVSTAVFAQNTAEQILPVNASGKTVSAKVPDGSIDYAKEAVLVFKNNSDCDVIINVRGNNRYAVEVAARDESSVVVKKDEYVLSGTTCNSKFLSAKSIQNNTVVTLNNSANISDIRLAQNTKASHW